MANIVTTSTLVRGINRVVIHTTLTSDGSQETNTVLYDSSVQNALIKKLTGTATPDPLKCAIRKINFSNNSAAGVIKLNFDASTPVLAVTIPKNFAEKLDFSKEGGLVNNAGTGITGDITLTTTGLASGESLDIMLDVIPY